MDYLNNCNCLFAQRSINNVFEIINSSLFSLCEVRPLHKYGLKKCILGLIFSDNKPLASQYEQEIYRTRQVLYYILKHDQYAEEAEEKKEDDHLAFSDPFFTKEFFRKITKNNYKLIKETYYSIFGRGNYDELFVKGALQRLCAKVKEEESNPDSDVIKLAPFAATKENIHWTLSQIQDALRKGYTNEAYQKKDEMGKQWLLEYKLLGVLIDMVSDPKNKVFSAKGTRYGKKFIFELKKTEKVNKFYTNKKYPLSNPTNKAAFQLLLYKIQSFMKDPEKVLLPNAIFIQVFNMRLWSFGELHDKFDPELVEWYELLIRNRKITPYIEWTKGNMKTYRCFGYYKEWDPSSIAKVRKALERVKQSILSKSDPNLKLNLMWVHSWIERLKTPQEAIFDFQKKLQCFDMNKKNSEPSFIVRENGLSKEPLDILLRFDNMCYDCLLKYNGTSSSMIVVIKELDMIRKSIFSKPDKNFEPNLIWINSWIEKLTTPQEAISGFVTKLKCTNINTIVIKNSDPSFIIRKNEPSKEMASIVALYDKMCYDCFFRYNGSSSSIALVRNQLKQVKYGLPKFDPNFLPNLIWINLWIEKLATPQEAISDFIAEKEYPNILTILINNPAIDFTATNIRDEETLGFPVEYREENSNIRKIVATDFVYSPDYSKFFDIMLLSMEALLKKMDDLLSEAWKLGLCKEKDIEAYVEYICIKEYFIEELQSVSNKLDPFRKLVAFSTKDKKNDHLKYTVRDMAKLNKREIFDNLSFEKDCQIAMGDFFLIHEELHKFDTLYQEALERGSEVSSLVGNKHHLLLQRILSKHFFNSRIEEFHDDANNINENASNNNVEVFFGYPNDNEPSLT